MLKSFAKHLQIIAHKHVYGKLQEIVQRKEV